MEVGTESAFWRVAAHAFIAFGLSIPSTNLTPPPRLCEAPTKVASKRLRPLHNLWSAKDKRCDKNQLKIAFGTADGVIVDARVLSGNMDDKTYNLKTLDHVNDIRNR